METAPWETDFVLKTRHLHHGFAGWRGSVPSQGPFLNTLRALTLHEVEEDGKKGCLKGSSGSRD